MRFLSILFLCSAAFLFSEEEIQFECPFQCGQIGTPAVLNVEWEFVQCLYEADIFSHSISERLNHREIKARPSYEEHFIHAPPQNIYSPWYKKMIREGLVLSNEIATLYASPYTDYAAFWKIRPIRNENRSEIGKKFEREIRTGFIPKQLEKLGIWQEGALHLRQAKPARKQHNLNKLCDGRGLKGNGCRRSQKPIFQVVWV